MEDKEILRRILQGFKLIPAKFPLTYTTIAGKATSDLAKRINAWIQTNFPNSLIRVAFDTTHGILKFYRRMQEQLVMEYILRRIIQEADLTNLGIGSFRGSSHKDRTNKFVDYLSSNPPTPIPLKNDKSVIVNKVQVITKADKAKEKEDVAIEKADTAKKKKDKKTPKQIGTIYSVSNLADMESLKQVLPKLSAGDSLYLYDSGNNKHSISTVAKTTDLGGKGKGFQRGSEGEAIEIANIQKQIDAYNTTNEGISIIGAGDNIVGIKPVEGSQKADFKFINAAGEAVAYIQHKSPKYQQMSGIGRDPIRNYPEVQSFAKKVYDIVMASENQRLESPEKQLIVDEELKKLAVYGSPEEGPKGVQFYCIGPMQLKKVDGDKFELTVPEGKGGVFTGGRIPDGTEAPTLVATYRAGRNQVVPVEVVPGTKKKAKLVIPDTRIGIYPNNYISNP
jgi:hypothetical protein